LLASFTLRKKSYEKDNYQQRHLRRLISSCVHEHLIVFYDG